MRRRDHPPKSPILSPPVSPKKPHPIPPHPTGLPQASHGPPTVVFCPPRTNFFPLFVLLSHIFCNFIPGSGRNPDYIEAFAIILRLGVIDS